MFRIFSSRAGQSLGTLARLALFAVLAYWLAKSYGAGSGAGSAIVGKAAPAFAGHSLEGSEVSLVSLKGRVVVLDFWATWCPPCRKAIPRIQSLSKRFSDRPVTVLGINMDQGKSPEAIRQFLSENSIAFGQVLDGGPIAQKYGVQGIPCTVVIDKDGIVRQVHTGYSNDLEGVLADSVEKLL
ncbi:MAG: TlpA family protein disulfide reductase [Candidatus Wallbacteria bacterium]|nr:TlpA family protein disulfide reductase [Candidatus Wallbacteria bacterium]